MATASFKVKFPRRQAMLTIREPVYKMSVTTIVGYAGMLPRHCPWCGAMVVKEGE